MLLAEARRKELELTTSLTLPHLFGRTDAGWRRDALSPLIGVK